MDPLDAVTRRVDLRLIPLLTILYFFSYLDRINIGNAQVSGLTNDTDSTHEFNWAVSIFYVSYVSYESSQWNELLIRHLSTKFR